MPLLIHPSTEVVHMPTPTLMQADVEARKSAKREQDTMRQEVVAPGIRMRLGSGSGLGMLRWDQDVIGIEIRIGMLTWDQDVIGIKIRVRDVDVGSGCDW